MILRLRQRLLIVMRMLIDCEQTVLEDLKDSERACTLEGMLVCRDGRIPANSSDVLLGHNPAGTTPGRRLV